MTTTPRYVIDSARTRHWGFAQAQGGDGPALMFLNSRLRTHLASHGAKIEGLVGAAVAYDLPLTGGTLLVTNSGVLLITNFGLELTTSGTALPTLGTAYADGWAIHVTGGGVPYVDFSEPPIAGDPFGVNGGVVGIPLPTDMIRLIAVSGVLSNPTGQEVPIDVVPEPQRFTTLPGRHPAAFLSGNRLVPIRGSSVALQNTGDWWDSVTTIRISYVPLQTLTSLDTVMNLPSVLEEALISDLAHYFALQSKDVPTADKVAFREEAMTTAAVIGAAALDTVNDAEEEAVIYNG